MTDKEHRTHSPFLTPSGPADPSSLKQGQLYWAAKARGEHLLSLVLQWVRSRASSPECCSQGGTGTTLCVVLCSRPLVVVSGDMDSNTDHNFSRATVPDMHPGSSPDPDITMTPCSKWATCLSPLLTTFTSLDLPLSTGRERFCLSPIPHRTFAHHNSAWLSGTVKEGRAFSLLPGHACGSPCPS